ncbi:MAG: DnaJ domain-containing protein [Alphaproteobacteria bacterium]|nr:DnaJ domain-containing protein [Alphaproteobacteria bacterium]
MKKNFVSTSDIPSMRNKQSLPRQCAHDACSEDGLYPAPKTRENLRDYIWFCLDHVREYNKQWNYFADMDETDIDQCIRRATTWERPSWHFGTNSKARDFASQFDDPLGLFGQDNIHQKKEKPISKEEKQAWKELELSPNTKWPEIKQQYKSLVKKHHPDANGGAKEAEEKLKSINQAFSVLEKAYSKSM